MAEPGIAPLPGGAAARTYHEYYRGERGHIPLPDRIGGYLAGYSFADGGGGVVPMPASLRDQTVTLSDRQPMTFLCLVPGTDGFGEVTILHHFVRYLDAPGDDPLGYNDKVLGLLGGILPHQNPSSRYQTRRSTWWEHQSGYPPSRQ